MVDGHPHNTACTSVGISREVGVGWSDLDVALGTSVSWDCSSVGLISFV